MKSDNKRFKILIWLLFICFAIIIFNLSNIVLPIDTCNYAYSI